jgi:hypothetical protein
VNDVFVPKVVIEGAIAHFQSSTLISEFVERKAHAFYESQSQASTACGDFARSR